MTQNPNGSSIYVCSSCSKEFSAEEAMRAASQCPACNTFLQRKASEQSTQPRVSWRGEGVATAPHLRSPGPTSFRRPVTLGTLNRSAPGVSPPSDSLSAPVGQLSHEYAPEDNIVALKIAPQKESMTDIGAITQLYNALSGAVGPIILEISATKEQRYLIVRCQREDASIVKGQITGIYESPDISLLPPEEDPAVRLWNHNPQRSYVRLLQNKSAGLPIKTYQDLPESDTILPLLSSLYGIEDSEACVVQIVIHGKAPEKWAAQYRQELLAIKRKETSGKSLSFKGILKILLLGAASLAGGIYFMLGEWLKYSWILLIAAALAFVGIKLAGKSDLEWNETIEDLVAMKVQQPAYMVEIRIVSAAANAERAFSINRGVVGAFGVFASESGNSFVPAKGDALVRFNPMELPEITSEKYGMILGDVELATLWHLPTSSSSIPDMLPVVKVKSTLPDATIFDNPDGVKVGQVRNSVGKFIPAILPIDAFSNAHTMVIGRTRTGKSTLIQTIFNGLVKIPGRSIIVIDPHMELVDDLLRMVPPERVGDVIYIDFASHDYVPGINPLDINLHGGDPEKAAAAFMEGAKSMFSTFWGPRMEPFFARVTAALTWANTLRAPDQQFTILDMITFMTAESKTRLAFLDQFLPKNYATDSIVTYFKQEYEELSPKMREDVRMPVLSKLRAFQTSSPLLAVFGQPNSSFDPAVAMRESKIMLIQTGMTDVSKEFSGFIGSWFLSMLTRAVFAQASLPPEDRVQINFMVDEAQTMYGYSYPEAMAQTGKFGGYYLISTQGTKFLGYSSASDIAGDPDAFAKVMANTDTLCVYRMDGAGAVDMCKTEFVDEQEPAHLINMPDHEAYVRFNRKGKINGPFRIQMDKPEIGSGRSVVGKIKSMRGSYSIPFEEALKRAEMATGRLIASFHHAVAEDKASDGNLDGLPAQVSSQYAENMPSAARAAEGSAADILSTALNPTKRSVHAKNVVDKVNKRKKEDVEQDTENLDTFMEQLSSLKPVPRDKEDESGDTLELSATED